MASKAVSIKPQFRPAWAPENGSTLRYEIRRSEKTAEALDADERAAMVELVLSEMAGGRTLEESLHDYHGVDAGSVRQWIAADEDMYYTYLRSRMLMAQALAEEALQVARASDGRNIAGDRLRVDVCQWAAVKMSPKEFGDKQQVETNENKRLEIVMRSDDGAMVSAQEILQEVE